MIDDWMLVPDDLNRTVREGEEPPRHSDQLTTGERVGRYAVRHPIASGSYGSVYVADDLEQDRQVALKVLHRQMVSQPQSVQRFLLEVRIIQRIRHPNIVELYDFGTLPDGRPFYAMELLEARNLHMLIEEQGRLSPAEALTYLEAICAALGAAHAAGVIHRDLKSSNVAICASGTAKLLDFGIAKLLHPDPDQAGLTVAGQLLGTPCAMAPEQIRGGQIDARTDIYALGVLLYEMLTSKLPFSAATPWEMERLHLESPPPRPSQHAPVGPGIDAVILRCLSKDPEQRYQSVAAFLDALREVVSVVHPPQAAARTGLAVAILLHVSLAGIDEDDGLLGELAMALDTAEQELPRLGFALPIQTSNAVLGVRLLSDDPEAARIECQQAIEHAWAVRHKALTNVGQPRLLLTICVHAGSVSFEPSARGPRVLGGEILRFGAWLEEGVAGVLVTPAARRLMSPFKGPGQDRHPV